MSETFKPSRRLAVTRWANTFSAPEQVQQAGEKLRAAAESVGLRLDGTPRRSFNTTGSMNFHPEQPIPPQQPQ